MGKGDEILDPPKWRVAGRRNPVSGKRGSLLRLGSKRSAITHRGGEREVATEVHGWAPIERSGKSSRVPLLPRGDAGPRESFARQARWFDVAAGVSACRITPHVLADGPSYSGGQRV